MSLLFRTRSRERDFESDSLRFERLGRAVSQIHAEIQNELEGLRSRYESVAASAAFSQQAFEDDQGCTDLSVRVGDLTVAMMHYSRRMASLDRQCAFAAELEEKIAAFGRMLEHE